MAINFKNIEKNAEDKVTLKSEAAKYILTTGLPKIEYEEFIQPLRQKIMQLFTEEALQERLEKLLVEDDTFKEQRYIVIKIIDNTVIHIKVAPDKPEIRIWQSASSRYGIEIEEAITISGNLYKKGINNNNSETVSLAVREDINLTNDDLLSYFWGDDKKNHSAVYHYSQIINETDISGKTLDTLLEEALTDCGFKIIDIKGKGTDELEIKMLNPFYKGE